jgi:hypothetical protein
MEMAGVAGRQALHELIAVRAYELWESHGRPHGFDRYNWNQAEQEIMSCVGESNEPGGSATALFSTRPVGAAEGSGTDIAK